MPDTPTPGEVCYEAWYEARYPKFQRGISLLEWQRLGTGDQHAWEAAAQAVRAMQKEDTTDAP